MYNSMENLKLVNDSKYIGNKNWSWNIWLEGSAVDQGKVISVKYFLHPTFQNPIHLITDKASKFKLSGSGWGEFNVKAEILIEGQTKLTLNHWLKFNDKETLDTLSTFKGKVFLSHSVTDGPIASRLAYLLIKKGYDVTASAIIDITTGVDWQKVIKNNIELADVNVVFILKGMSEYIGTEINLILSREKNIAGKLLPVLLGSVDMEECIVNYNIIRISSINEIGKVADAVERMINK